MKKMFGQMIVLLVLVGATTAMSSAEAQTKIDDFEKYKEAQKIGTSWDSDPWRRFGAATNDNVIVTRAKSKVITGGASAQYSVFWPNKFGCAQYAFEAPTDASAHQAVTFKMRSNEPATRTKVQLSVTDGTATYLSKEGFLLTDQTQNISFALAADNMVLVDGTGSYQDVLTRVTAIGFQFQSSEGQYLETIFFDDLAFSDTSTAKAD